MYARKDERLRGELDTHMAVLRGEGVISLWHDRMILPGQEWHNVITENLKASRVFLLLVSPDFLASDYIQNTEMDYALKMHDEGQGVVIPIILRKCQWNRTRLKHLQALPKDGKPITLWSDRDTAWTDVAEGIRRLVDDLRAKYTVVGELLRPIPPVADGGDSSSDGDSSPGIPTPSLASGVTNLAIKSLHQLRAPVADFVGRESEIDQVVQALSIAAKSGVAAISGARGMGGIGKSELAYAVAQRLLDTFPDAQLLLELRGAGDNPFTAEQALQTVIRAFEPLAQLPSDLTVLGSLYRSLLSGKRVLVLADDARDAEQVEALLPPSGCALLLTSRQHFPLPGMETVDLGTLPQAEAEKLLLEICPDIGSAAPRMAQLCGRLPLALRISAGLCANSAMNIERQLDALEGEKTRLALLRDPDKPNDPTKSVEASFQLSYASLDEPMQKVLCQLSVFPASFDMDAASAVVVVPGAGAQGTPATSATSLPLDERLALLFRRSLLEWDRPTRRYTLHDLVRDFALARLVAQPQVEDVDAVRLRHAQHYATVAAHAHKLYKKGGEDLLLGLRLFDMERANIDAGWGWAREHTERSGGGSRSQEVANILVDYAFSTTYVGDLRYDKRKERIPQFEAALDAARSLSRRGAEGAALGTLGLAYADLGEMRTAIQYHEQYLEIAREIGDRRGEGNALGNLGTAYSALGEIPRAIQFHEQALKVSRATGDRRGEGSDLGNLGLAYAALGEMRTAIQYLEQRLEIAREIGDRRGEGNALSNLGTAYSDLREMRTAIQYSERSLEIARKIGDRQVEAFASWNLGILLMEKGDLARAIELQQVTVDYEREIGHVDAEKDAARVEELRKELVERSSMES
jgi:tetratricopeptide (TPR) repeat protein